MDFKVKTNIAHVRYIALKKNRTIIFYNNSNHTQSYRNSLQTTILEGTGYHRVSEGTAQAGGCRGRAELIEAAAQLSAGTHRLRAAQTWQQASLLVIGFLFVSSFNW